MSDPNMPDRDASGRFLKPTEAPEPRRPGDDEMHPAARMMFGWVSAKWAPNLILLVVAVVSLLLIVIDLQVHRNEEADFANMTGFYAFWGFGALVLIVFSAWPLGHLLRRDEDYYGEGDETPRIDGAEDRQ